MMRSATCEVVVVVVIVVVVVVVVVIGVVVMIDSSPLFLQSEPCTTMKESLIEVPLLTKQRLPRALVESGVMLEEIYDEFDELQV